MEKSFFSGLLLVLLCVACSYSYAQDRLVGVTTTNVNLRTGPGTSYQSLGQIVEGSHLTILEGPTNGWYRVAMDASDGNRYEGFVSNRYVGSIRKIEDYSLLPKVYAGLTGEKREIGCENITPVYDECSGCSFLIDARWADYDVVLKLYNSYDECIRMVFVKKGTSFEITKIPVGYYYYKMASGVDMRKKVDEWGNCCLVFVENASYERCENQLRFRREIHGDYYMDNTITLTLNARKADGEEVKSDSISMEEFNR